jgi:hypothetical protein
VVKDNEFRITRYKLKDVSEELFKSTEYKIKVLKKNVRLESLKRDNIKRNIMTRQKLVKEDPGKFIKRIFENKK